MSNTILSTLSYNSYLPSAGLGGAGRYSEIKLLIGDAYKEQQYWLSVYNHAQQFGLKGTSMEDIITQLARVGDKLNSLQSFMLPAAQQWMEYENTTNQQMRQIFSSSQT